MDTNILIVIPARGGSKGIPRKNLRLLAGLPMMAYSINTALSLSLNTDVVVSSEDAEIQVTASKLGAKIVNRSEGLSGDGITLDSVVYDAVIQAEKQFNRNYEVVVTMQPTSPLLKVSSLQRALEILLHDENSTDTVISVVDDRHLGWQVVDGKVEPNYKERLNRQYLPPTFRETGGFVISKREYVTVSSRFGKKIQVFPLNEREAIDIDTYSDWALCSYHLKRKRVVIAVVGYHEIGLGHVFNTLAVAGGILDHEIIFVVSKDSELAYELITRNNYEVHQQREDEQFQDTIIRFNPDIVINDVLDTALKYMTKLKANTKAVINFEDLGEGAQIADLVVNAMYPERVILPNHYFGHSYFCLRSEFLIKSNSVSIRQKVEKVLITFGGVDPNNFTARVLGILLPICKEQGIEITVILGKGYNELSTLSKFKESVLILKDVKNISTYMESADIAITSAGRTTFEIASLGIPTMVLCQNKRETTHFFASAQFGFHNFGLGSSVTDDQILASFTRLLTNVDERRAMSDLMLGFDIKGGGNRVLNLIKQVIDNVS